jgi:hypothetical protein
MPNDDTPDIPLGLPFIGGSDNPNDLIGTDLSCDEENLPPDCGPGI